LGEGNDRADRLVACAAPRDEFQAAKHSHEVFHQNAKGLCKQFKISIGDAKGIVQTCPECSNHGAGLGLGVNPRGLQANQIWQMDVTHVPEFGRLKYVHVCIDTHSHAMWATAQ
ncbi:POK10 protein, partial [Zapornia atra]|nr:POK10 protein [Zapornia atra]